jgi:Nickel responsive protein SCO4226-like
MRSEVPGSYGRFTLPTEGGAMPLYMDVHSLDGAVTFEDVGKAHQADLQTQGGYDVSYLRYWVDGKHGKIFCLVEAPNADAAATVHREAHGLVAEEIYQVQEGS